MLLKGDDFLLLKQIKYFVTVVKCNSFTEAAEECFISQSAISQQIQSLEDELNVKLLERKNRKFSITPAGEYFYHKGLILLDEAERIKQETIKIGNNNKNRIRIGYVKQYFGQELQNAIAEFTQIHKDTDIHIANGTHDELYEMLINRKVDLVLNDQRRAFSDLYENYYLYKCNSYIEISNQSILSRLEHIEIGDLKSIPCILIASKEQQKIEQDFYRDIMGFQGEFIFVDNLEEGRLLVAGNKGVMPIDGKENIPKEGAAITRIPLYRNENIIERDYYAFWKKDNDSEKIKDFATILYNNFLK